MLGIILILQGVFLLFALAFNGGVGEDFVNYSFFLSALLMIITGGLKISKANWSITSAYCLAGIIFYLPMIWQRFNFSFGTDHGGLSFDFWVIVIMLIALIGKPNKQLQATQKPRA